MVGNTVATRGIGKSLLLNRVLKMKALALTALLIIAAALGVACLSGQGDGGPQDRSSDLPSGDRGTTILPLSPAASPTVGPTATNTVTPPPPSTQKSETETAAPPISQGGPEEKSGPDPSESAVKPETSAIPPLLQSSKDVVVDPSQFRQLLPKDAIAPIYQPKFVSSEFSGLEPGELVIGVSLNGENKAYPIGPLVRREMVNDEVGGIPILVTW